MVARSDDARHHRRHADTEPNGDTHDEEHHRKREAHRREFDRTDASNVERVDNVEEYDGNETEYHWTGEPQQSPADRILQQVNV